MTFRQGEIAAVDLGTQRVSLTLAGGTKPYDDIPYLGWYFPVVGDTVWVEQRGPNAQDLLVVGSQASQGPARGLLDKATTTSSVNFGSIITDVLTGNAVSFLEGRAYEVGACFRGVGSDVASVLTIISITTTANTTIRDVHVRPGATAVTDGGGVLSRIFNVPADTAAGSYTFKIRAVRSTGSGTQNVSATATSPIELWVKDIGEAL